MRFPMLRRPRAPANGDRPKTNSGAVSKPVRWPAALTGLLATLQGDNSKGVVIPTATALDRHAPPFLASDPPNDLERRAFSVALGDDDRAEQQLKAKREWRPTVHETMDTIAPFLRSEGFVVCLEGLTDAHGDPLVLSNGMAHGTKLEVQQQVSYAHERVLAQCVALGRPALRATTIVNVRNPTFRFPDAALRSAIAMTDSYYPWHTSGRTIFVGFPSAVRHVFERLRGIMSAEFFNAIEFADDWGALADGIVPRESVPAELLGGSASWCLEEYISRRCEAEGVYAPVDDDGAPSVRPYAGRRLNLALFDTVQ
jgi:hypothetical protein